MADFIKPNKNTHRAQFVGHIVSASTDMSYSGTIDPMLIANGFYFYPPDVTRCKYCGRMRRNDEVVCDGCGAPL